ncbi:rhoptry kinase family protein [Cyclospora cayetanensis]|uniref:Rhoptry kinase family protein n=1 Tax=Cyclospora cayetanensis TaxID=88456 RepID=A0A1D3CZ14_9EIME|nr:rhoptry kinase family protein [Cyclospora cayetanensis]
MLHISLLGKGPLPGLPPERRGVPEQNLSYGIFPSEPASVGFSSLRVSYGSSHVTATTREGGRTHACPPLVLTVMGATREALWPLAVGALLLGTAISVWVYLPFSWQGPSGAFEMHQTPPLQALSPPHDEDKIGETAWSTLGKLEPDQLERITSLLDLSLKARVTAAASGEEDSMAPVFAPFAGGALQSLEDFFEATNPMRRGTANTEEEEESYVPGFLEEETKPFEAFLPASSWISHDYVEPSEKREEELRGDTRWAEEGLTTQDMGSAERRLSEEPVSELGAVENPLGYMKSPTKLVHAKGVNAPARQPAPEANVSPHAKRGWNSQEQAHGMAAKGSWDDRMRGPQGASTLGTNTAYHGVPARAPNEYYTASKGAPPITGLRWMPDPRVLRPELLRDLVQETSSNDLVKERASTGWMGVAAWELGDAIRNCSARLCPFAHTQALWEKSYGFNREIIVSSSARRGVTYRLIFTDVLGVGGIGIVLAAVDVTNGRRLAVKVCRLKGRSRRGLHYDMDLLRRRVQQEVSLWKYVPPEFEVQQWSRISQVVIPVDMVGPAETVHSEGDNMLYSEQWAIFEVFAGDLLSIKQIWKGSMIIKIETTKQLMYATMSLHAMGLVHSDIKPPNFFVHHDGRIYLGDNGLCLPMNQNSECINGTRRYMPPENMRCQLYEKRRIFTSERKDSWALGVLLFQLFCSDLPFDFGNSDLIWTDSVAVDASGDTATDSAGALSELPTVWIKQRRDRRREGTREIVGSQSSPVPSPASAKE